MRALLRVQNKLDCGDPVAKDVNGVVKEVLFIQLNTILFDK